MKKAFSFFFAFMLFVSFSELAFSQKQLPVKITPVDKNAPGKLSSVNQNIVTIGNNNDNSLINQTVLPGNGSTSGNGRAPQGSRRFVNIKYVISGAEMTASGFGANAITSIGWRYNVPGFGTPVAQSFATTGRIIVYVKDTVGTATTVGSTFIDTNGVGYTKIIEGTFSMPSTSSEMNIDVPVGGPGTSTFIPTP